MIIMAQSRFVWVWLYLFYQLQVLFAQGHQTFQTERGKVGHSFWVTNQSSLDGTGVE